MSLFNSFFHRIWLSIVVFLIMMMLAAQAIYMHSLDRIKSDWEVAYKNKFRELTDTVIAITQKEGIDKATNYINSLQQEKKYFALYYVNESSLIDQKKHSFIFDVADEATVQMIYFKDDKDQPVLLEVKNIAKNNFLFSLTWKGFLLRSLPIFIFGLLFAYFWTRRICAPILEIARSAKSIAEGNLNTRLPEKLTRQSNEIGDLAVRFNYMIESVDTLQKNQQRMLSDIAHELRSPLSRQKLALNLLKNDEIKNDQEKSNELIERAEEEGNRLNELIDEVMNYLRPMQQKRDKTVDEEEVLLGYLLESVAEDASFEFSLEDKQLIVDLNENIAVMGNYIQLERAIENVIRNALFHTYKGTSVHVVLTKTDNCAIITIEDKGEGVPEEQLVLLTTPFYRTDSARNKNEGGYGLGTSIADAIIHQNGGQLLFENITPHGLKATIILPLKK